jgi:hypothetical protein
MKKLKQSIIPAIVLLLFAAIMNSGEFLKKPFGSNDDVERCIQAVKSDVKSEKWQQASVDLKKLKTAWKIVEKRVQFSVERDEMILIDTNISRIEGAISVHDKSSSIIELEELLGHWNELEE